MELLIRAYTPDSPLPESDWPTVTGFLHRHLERFGDPEPAIRKCLAYAMSSKPEHGGGLYLAYLNEGTGEALVGACITNQTHMEAYIPATILVYIAVDGSKRGNGIGRKLMETVQAQSKGGIALHVEPDNPAKHLYETLGFTNKYLEMRYEPS